MKQQKINNHTKALYFKKIAEELKGYWGSDRWDVRLCPVLKGPWKRNNVYLKFEIIKQPVIRNEIKYYLYKRLVEFSLSPESAWKSHVINDLGRFFEQYYPSMVSIIDVDKDILLNKYKKHLIKHGKSIVKKDKNMNSDFGRTIILIYDFYTSYYDDRDEISKDIWNIHKLDIKVNQVPSNKLINFTNIPFPHRKLVKKYIKERLIIYQNIAEKTAIGYTRSFSLFYSFINEMHPNWDNISELTRDDIVDFIGYLRKTPTGGNSNSKSLYNHTLSKLKISQVINHRDIHTFYPKV